MENFVKGQWWGQPKIFIYSSSLLLNVHCQVLFTWKTLKHLLICHFFLCWWSLTKLTVLRSNCQICFSFHHWNEFKFCHLFKDEPSRLLLSSILWYTFIEWLIFVIYIKKKMLHCIYAFCFIGKNKHPWFFFFKRWTAKLQMSPTSLKSYQCIGGFTHHTCISWILDYIWLLH